jgi:hypothetical protein
MIRSAALVRGQNGDIILQVLTTDGVEWKRMKRHELLYLAERAINLLLEDEENNEAKARG